LEAVGRWVSDMIREPTKEELRSIASHLGDKPRLNPDVLPLRKKQASSVDFLPRALNI
jgi:hypothetical protein